MRGRIKRFIEDKGYGFITGEDGQDYFFHISQVRDMVEIKNWMIVNFDIIDGKKGKNAVNIKVSEQNNTSRFVTCGNVNIRLNNIKEYGFGKYPVLYERYFIEKICKEKTIFGTIQNVAYWTGMNWYDRGEISDSEVEYYRSFHKTLDDYRYGEISILVQEENGELKHFTPYGADWNRVSNVDMSSSASKQLYAIGQKNYLYIETYQKENFQFKEDQVSFNIYDKYNEINNAMKK